MAFTEAQLLTDLLTTEGPNPRITAFIPIGTTMTDVYVENLNGTKLKAGGLQIAQTNTAAQAHTLLTAALN